MAAVRSACRWKVQRHPPDCRRIVIRLRYGIMGQSDRRTTSSGQSAWSTSREPVLDTSGEWVGSSRSDGGRGGGPRPQAPVSWGQARASGMTGARLADTGRSGADGIRYAGGNGGGLHQPGVGVSVTPGTCQARLRSQGNRLGRGCMVHVHAKTTLTEPVRPGFGRGLVRGRSGRVHPDGARAGKGAAGVPGQLGDDGGARLPRCSPPDRRRHGGPGLRHVIRGLQGDHYPE